MDDPIQPKTEEPEIPKREPADTDDELAIPLPDDDLSSTMLLSQTDNEQEVLAVTDITNESSDRNPVSDVIISSQFPITQPKTFSCKSNYLFGILPVIQSQCYLKVRSN